MVSILVGLDVIYLLDSQLSAQCYRALSQRPRVRDDKRQGLLQRQLLNRLQHSRSSLVPPED